MNRRSFLAYSGTIGLCATAIATLPGICTSRFNRKLYSTTLNQKLMGTFVRITLLHNDQTRAEEVAGLVFEEMEKKSLTLSRFENDSAVSVLNRDGVLNYAPDELLQIVQRSKHFHTISDQNFDISVFPLLKLYEEHHTLLGNLPADHSIRAATKLIDSNKIQISGRKISYAMDKMSITLDGIAKGFVVDCGAELIRQHGIKQAMINAGGDIWVTGGKEGNKPWKIGITNPVNPEHSSHHIALTEGAIATSGNYEVYFDDEKLHHHILNPSSGKSPNEISSATVISDSVMNADALSTTLFLIGAKKGKQLIDRLPQTECLIQGNASIATSNGWRVA